MELCGFVRESSEISAKLLRIGEMNAKMSKSGEFFFCMVNFDLENWNKL